VVETGPAECLLLHQYCVKSVLSRPDGRDVAAGTRSDDDNLGFRGRSFVSHSECIV